MLFSNVFAERETENSLVNIYSYMSMSYLSMLVFMWDLRGVACECSLFLLDRKVAFLIRVELYGTKSHKVFDGWLPHTVHILFNFTVTCRRLWVLLLHLHRD